MWLCLEIGSLRGLSRINKIIRLGSWCNDWRPYEKRDLRNVHAYTQRPFWAHSERVAFGKLRRKVSPDPNLANSLMLDFWSPDFEETCFYYLSHPACGTLLRPPKQINTLIVSCLNFISWHGSTSLDWKTFPRQLFLQCWGKLRNMEYVKPNYSYCLSFYEIKNTSLWLPSDP